MAGTLRRSKRERKQALSFYEESKQVEERSAQKKKKQRASLSATKKRQKEEDSDTEHESDREEMDVEEEDEQQDDNDSENEDDNDEKMSDSEEEESSSEEEDEEEEYTPNKKPAASSASKSKRGSTATKKKSTATPKTAKPRKLNLNKTTTKKKGTNRQAPVKKGAQTALKTLAKKLLDNSETPETSLVAALLNAFQQDPKGTSSTKLSQQIREKQTKYTLNLIQAVKQVIDEHHKDPNAAQVTLYNFVFRSSGASLASSLDPAEVDLENINDADLEDYIHDIAESMEECSADAVPLDLDGHNTAGGKTYAVAAREYQAIYREFWYLLGAVALSDSMWESKTKSGRKSKRARMEDDSGSSSSDDSDDDDENNPEAPQGMRFQIEMMREVLKRLQELTCLTQVDLRAAVVVALYELAAAVLERTVELRQKLATAERQLKIAKKNRMKRKAEALEGQTEAWNRMCTELESLVMGAYEGVFSRRYKDVHPQIRAESMKFLAKLVVARPDLFLKNSHLKYFGWMLSDKSPVVREEAIKGLLAPFQHNQQISSSSRSKRGDDARRIDTSVMESMAEKFAERLSECANDEETSVQESSIRLMLAFSNDGLLEGVNDDAVWERINERAVSKNTVFPVRRLAMEFVLEQLENFDTSSAGLSETDAATRINDIATWICHKLVPKDKVVSLPKIPFSHVSLVVSALRAIPAHYPLVTHYAAMLLALQEHGEGDEENGPSQSQFVSKTKQQHEIHRQHIILEMLVASVEQEMSTIGSDALEDVVDPSLIEKQRKETTDSAAADESKKLGSNVLQERLTVAILEALPELLPAYKTDMGLLRRLTALPKYFLTSVLNTSSQKRQFSALLDQVSSIFLSTTDEVVLANCGLSLTLLAKGDHVRSSEALVALKKCASSVTEQLNDLLVDKAELEEYEDLMEVEATIGVCLRRLDTLSKRWSIASLINEEDQLEELAAGVSRSIERDLAQRKPVRDEEEETDAQEELVAEIWEVAPTQLHAEILASLPAAISFLTNTAAWSLNENLDKEPNDRNTAFVTGMRDRLVRIASLCFEIYVEDSDRYEDHYRQFCRTVQRLGTEITSSLRALFPHALEGSQDAFLLSVALVDYQQLVGGSVRFLRNQEGNIRGNPESNVARSVLLPFARGLYGNWKHGNRREAGAVLAHVKGSGKDAEALVGALSKQLKKEDAVRLLEAHMASLRQAFEDWAENEPEEPPSSHPSEEEIEEFEELEKAHQAKFALIEAESRRLSDSLGVGKLSDKNKKLQNALLGFVLEGVRFSFSTENLHGGDPLFLGSRLPFLKILGHYLRWIKNDKNKVAVLREHFNEKETELRNHPEYKEVFEDDLALLDVFRSNGNLGAFLVVGSEEDDEKTKGDAYTAGGSVAGSSVHGSSAPALRRRRLSHASSITSFASKSTAKSLSPLPEGKEDDEEPEEEEETRDDDHSTAGSSISSKGTSRKKKHSLSPATAKGSTVDSPSTRGSSPGTKGTEDPDREDGDSEAESPATKGSSTKGGTARADSEDEESAVDTPSTKGRSTKTEDED